jgi:hypothetical protein
VVVRPGGGDGLGELFHQAAAEEAELLDWHAM